MCHQSGRMMVDVRLFPQHDAVRRRVMRTQRKRDTVRSWASRTAHNMWEFVAVNHRNRAACCRTRGSSGLHGLCTTTSTHIIRMGFRLRRSPALRCSLIFFRRLASSSVLLPPPGSCIFFILFRRYLSPPLLEEITFKEMGFYTYTDQIK